MTLDSRAAAECGSPAWLFSEGDTDGGEIHGVVPLDEWVIKGVAHGKLYFLYKQSIILSPKARIFDSQLTASPLQLRLEGMVVGRTHPKCMKSSGIAYASG
jgi:hypothetical protein